MRHMLWVKPCPLPALGRGPKHNPSTTASWRTPVSLSSSWAHMGLILSRSKSSWKMAHSIAPLRESWLNTLHFSPLPKTNNVRVTPHCTSSPRPFTSLHLNLDSPGPLLFHSTGIAHQHLHPHFCSTTLPVPNSATWPPHAQASGTGSFAHDSSLPPAQGREKLKGNSCRRSACMPQIRQDSTDAQQLGACLPPAAW